MKVLRSASSRRRLLRLSSGCLPTVGTVAPRNLIALNRVHRETLRVTQAHALPPVAAYRTRGDVLASFIAVVFYDVKMSLQKQSDVVIGTEVEHLFGIRYDYRR